MLELAFAFGIIANIAIVLFFAHRRRDISIARMYWAMMPGFVIIFGIYGYAELGFSLAEVFWLSVVFLVGAAGYIGSFMRTRRYVREHVPGVRERQKNYWKKRILSEQARGLTPLDLQKSGRLPGNEELFDLGLDEVELQEFGLLD